MSTEPVPYEQRGVWWKRLHLKNELKAANHSTPSTHNKNHLYSRVRCFLYHVPACVLLLSLCITPEYPRDFTDFIMQCFYQLTNSTTSYFARYMCVPEHKINKNNLTKESSVHLISNCSLFTPIIISWRLCFRHGHFHSWIYMILHLSLSPKVPLPARRQVTNLKSIGPYPNLIKLLSSTLEETDFPHYCLCG